jgi:hypothetical protein
MKCHLAYIQGQAKTCPNAFGDINSQMQATVESFHVEKAKENRMKDEIGRS